MRINVCIPTRGKPAYVEEYPAETLRNAVLPGTRIVLGYDHDDVANPPSYSDDRQVIVSVAQREDALGAKWNRCARAYDADLYVMAVDDVAIATKGWDEILARRASNFKDGIGYVYFGKNERLPSMIAVTRKIVDTIGFCQEFTPFWWSDTWIDEVAHLIGGHGVRIYAAPIETRYPKGDLPEPPRRDVNFWAEFFDHTRILRVRQAEQLIALMDDGPTAKAMLRASRRAKLEQFLLWNSNLRQPEWAAAVTKVTEPRDARHERLRAKAIATVESLTRKAA